MYGWRGRIGLMVPTGNSVMEPEFNRLAPEGVSVHANRVYLKNVTPETLEAELGKPVISSNQATFADCLRILGVRQVRPGFGSLFERVFAAMDAAPAGEAEVVPLRARG